MGSVNTGGDKYKCAIRFKVENFSSIKDSMLSEHCVIRNLPWKIMIMQRQTQTNDRNTKSVGYFLQVWTKYKYKTTLPCSVTESLRALPGAATPQPTSG